MPALAAYAMTASFEQRYGSHGYSEDSSVDGGSGHPVQATRLAPLQGTVSEFAAS